MTSKIIIFLILLILQISHIIALIIITRREKKNSNNSFKNPIIKIKLFGFNYLVELISCDDTNKIFNDVNSLNLENIIYDYLRNNYESIITDIKNNFGKYELCFNKKDYNFIIDDNSNRDLVINKIISNIYDIFITFDTNIVCVHNKNKKSFLSGLVFEIIDKKVTSYGPAGSYYFDYYK